MTRPLTRHRTALALALFTTAPLGAQVTELSRTALADAAQLTFGHRCDDRFVLRNDGTQAVTLAYAVAKATTQTTLTLGAREVVELSSPSRHPLELWKDGTRIARAEKERRKCKDVQGTAAVQVSPLDVATTTRSPQPWYGYGAGVGWMGNPWFDPWFGGPWGAWGARPWGAGIVGVPIIIGRGGRRR
jgi:hypothetical protein